VSRSLVTLTVALVGGVVLLLGAAVVAWVAQRDRRSALEDARLAQDAAEVEVRALARDLLDLSQEVAGGLSESHAQRLRAWLEQEPLALHRDAADPDRVDVVSIMDTLVAEVRRRGQEEAERIAVLSDRLERFAHARVEAQMAAQRSEAEARVDRSASSRARALTFQLALLLLGMALLLGGTLGLLVVRPLRRLRGAVDRMARGDLETPIAAQGPAQEMRALSADVERLRVQLERLTVGLEEEVRRKTVDLETSLAERTRTLEELRSTQERLVQSAKMAGLGTLAGGVAHEFNNLLGGILGCIESARAEVPSGDLREDLDVAHRTALRAADLVRALLDVARPGQREMKPLDLRAIVQDVLRAAQPTAARRGVALIDEGGPPVRVQGDEGQLHQVVLNLVTNAMQAVDDRERVWIRVLDDGRHGGVQVRDEGAGVPPEQRARLFEPFFTTRADGTGLGLFVSYGIVERHGGRIGYDDAPEGGASFTVLLPLAAV